VLVVTLIFACAGGFYYLEWRAKMRDVLDAQDMIGETEERARQQESEIQKLQSDLEREAEPRLRAEAERTRAGRDLASLEDSLLPLVKRGEVLLDTHNNYIVVTLPSSPMFEAGSNTLTEEGRKVLARVARAIAARGPRDIFVGSHTDNVPIRADRAVEFPTNWELSAARATRVVRYLDEECGVLRRQLTAAGYSDSRPVASNQTEEGRAQNRRIEITIAPRILR
jgi:chemotaxis protein MotB